MGIQPQKTQRSQKMYLYITVCRAFLADHFSKKKFILSSTNDGDRVKILKM